MNTTTKRFCRSTSEAFQIDNACAIEHYRSVRRIGAWWERAMIAGAIVFVGFWILGVV